MHIPGHLLKLKAFKTKQKHRIHGVFVRLKRMKSDKFPSIAKKAFHGEKRNRFSENSGKTGVFARTI